MPGCGKSPIPETYARLFGLAAIQPPSYPGVTIEAGWLDELDDLVAHNDSPLQIIRDLEPDRWAAWTHPGDPALNEAVMNEAALKAVGLHAAIPADAPAPPIVWASARGGSAGRTLILFAVLGLALAILRAAFAPLL